MSEPKRIFIIGNFKDESPQSIRIERRRWVKGFIRLGHDVQRFSYRNIMLQCSLFKSKKFAQRFAKKSTDKILVEEVKVYYPDIVLVISMKYLDENTISALREVAPKAVFVGRDVDPFPEENLGRIAIAKKMDMVVATNAGRFLRTYKETRIPACAFIPNPYDPDIQHPYEVVDKWKSDIIFTGKEEHVELDRNAESDDINSVVDDDSGIRVPAKRLDAVGIESASVSMLKIDVEGYEKFVLEGAGHTLQKVQLSILSQL